MGTPLRNTFATWHALFLKTTLSRLFGKRMAWAWLLIDPAIQVLVFGMIRSLMRDAMINGVDMLPWMVIGMLSFFLFRRTASMAMHAIDCNKPYFAFRQVRPFDAVLTAAVVEGFVMTFVSIIILGFIGFFGEMQIIPHDPLLVLVSLGALFSFGLGYGMITSVVMRLIPESSHIFSLIMMPLYFLSGAILPLTSIPPNYREYLLLNPIVHGIESVRLGFFSTYHVVPGIELSYLYIFSFLLFAIGLTLYRVYETELVAL